MTPRVLVTGGSGFIGSHVVPALLAGGASVVVADLRPYSDGGVRCAVGDLSSPGSVEAALEPGTDAVVHLAALTSVLDSTERPEDTYRVNVGVTFALLERCRRLGVGTFVLASTNAVVGAGAGSLIDEQSPLRPLTPYGATKAAAEVLLSGYSVYGVRGVALRLTNVYGTGMVLKDSVVARIMRAARSGATFEVRGDGQQVRDYVDAEDVARAVQLALGSDVSGPLVVGSGTSTSVLSLLDLARAATGAPLPARHVPPEPGEMAAVRVDISRARHHGWTPAMALPAGLARVWAEWPVDVAASR